MDRFEKVEGSDVTLRCPRCGCVFSVTETTVAKFCPKCGFEQSEIEHPPSFILVRFYGKAIYNEETIPFSRHTSMVEKLGIFDKVVKAVRHTLHAADSD